LSSSYHLEPMYERVSRRSVLRAVGAAGAVALGTAPAAAASECKGSRTSDDDLPFDTGGTYGGWGGHEFHGTAPGHDQNPVVFVHGNTRSACDFSKHADEFLARGYLGDALWSISFREGTSTHPEMRDQLEGFVANVLAYTGASTVDVVAHSLGVTGARFWLAETGRYASVATFVGLAGANHGTSNCPTCTAYPGTGEPCQFISPLCADEPGEPLYELNHPDETPHADTTDYYTVRGTADTFYLDDPDSPRLDGAVRNVVLEGATHDEVRESSESIDRQYEWTTT
jgi:pimeloyl-ACP methyl ester carboxylesterase